MKKSIPVTYTLEKTFFAVATFEGLLVVFFQAKPKKCNSKLWSV